jgi:signal recognition particle subunit SRP54
VVNVPVAFAATGETIDDLEPFRPDRLVSRLLGMGDVLSLVEKAEQAVTRDDAAAMAERLRRNEFTLEDLRDQMRAVIRMGPIDQLLGLIPGLGRVAPDAGLDSGAVARMAAIIDSMTRRERRNPSVMNGSRRRRVARGSGTSVQQVNRLLRQFAEMTKMMKRAVAAGRGGRRNALRAALPR